MSQPAFEIVNSILDIWKKAMEVIKSEHHKYCFSNLLFITYSAISHNGKSGNTISYPSGTRKESYPYIGKDKQH